MRTLYLVIVLGLSGCATARVARTEQDMQALTAQQNLEVAQLLEQRGDTVRAEQYLHAALARGAAPNVVIPRLLRLYVADGQFQLAADQTETYLRRHPNDCALRLFLASLYTALGDEGRAVRQYEHVLRVKPDDAQAHYALATALHDSGHELGRADQHYRSYLQLDPSGPYAEEARSLLLTELP